MVADAKTADVFLHNGKQRLGSVSSDTVTTVREVIRRLSINAGSDQVLVCKLVIGDEAKFKALHKFNVYPDYSVNERLARKFSNKYRKDY